MRETAVSILHKILDKLWASVDDKTLLPSLGKLGSTEPENDCIREEV
jgi:hypothetical protein